MSFAFSFLFFIPFDVLTKGFFHQASSRIEAWKSIAFLSPREKKIILNTLKLYYNYNWKYCQFTMVLTKCCCPSHEEIFAMIDHD